MSNFSALSDDKLILLVKTTGDSASYGELVARHQSALQAFLTGFTGNRSTAEDLTQDSFIKAYQGLTSFKQNSSFKTWLFSIGYREFLQYNRKSIRFRKMLEAFKRTESQNETTELSENRDLQRALEKLTDMERDAVLLCDYGGMSHVEAANAMDAPLGSVKTYVQRARRLLNQSLGDVNG